jgi:uncharacterized protein (TIGR00730 family)
MADDALNPTPLVTSSPGGEDNAKHYVMGAHLSRVIEEGKSTMPSTPDPLVCKPREIEPWRVFKIMSEFVEGFDLLKKYALAVSVFGSTRLGLDPRYYEEAAALSGKLAKKGFAVITGGSAGIMEAANKGAYEAGGASVGLNIRLDENQAMNKFVTDEYTFDHFFVRKVMLTFASEAYIYFPGGFGTMDEFFEILTLVQTKKIRQIPIVLYGREYWDPFVERFRTEFLEKYKSIGEGDLELFTVVDSVDQAYEYLVTTVSC